MHYGSGWDGSINHPWTDDCPNHCSEPEPRPVLARFLRWLRRIDWTSGQEDR